MAIDSEFKKEVCALVSKIPKARVMTYGQIAALCNHPGAARAVGMIAHFGDSDLPWHRVVNRNGGMASGFVPEGRSAQEQLLNNEGVDITNNKLNLEEYIWWPKP